MSPEDPRHGKNSGYNAGCRDACCKAAHAAYRKNNRSQQYLRRYASAYVDSTGTQRRVKALMVLGWRYSDIVDRAPGVSRNWLRHLLENDVVHRDKAAAIAQIYDELSMRLGPSQQTRSRANRAGWVSPLAWDDNTIDDPNARPRRGTKTARKTLDEVVVERLLHGDRVTSTQAEKNEAMRRWVAAGKSRRSLCRLHGWRDNRYALEAS